MADVLLDAHVHDRPLISHRAPFEMMPPVKRESHRVFLMAMKNSSDLRRCHSIAAHDCHAIQRLEV